jgi:ribonuclease P protein component
MTRPHTLSRNARIRRRPEFQRAYDDGRRINGRFMGLVVVANGSAISRLGVAASRKLGGAVVRNRLKRLSREIFRRNTIADGLDIVVMPRREMLDASFASLEADYRDILARRDRAVAALDRRVTRGDRRPRPAARV